MPITATYSSAQFRLSVIGTLVADLMTVSRNAGGTLLVNGGAVPITGGTATVANTDLIEMAGDADNDTISLDETNGALPAAELSGGAGNDALTGGSAGDTLAGEVGNDTLLGRGGTDLLYGGSDNDTLTGGDGDDQMFGEDGDDRMIWNPGDDSDLMEGGIGTDTAEINGGNGAEVFTITANGTRVRFDRIDPAPFTLDIGTSETLVLNANGGDDTISTSGNLAALISLTIDGGAGNDTILGGNGSDTLLGGDGNDFIDGNQGNDVAFLGAGNDTFQWDPGDGSDIVEGQGDTDTLLFNGSAANEIFEISANGARTLFTRNVGNIVMDVNDVEAFTLNALGGTDTVTLNDLTGTDATTIAINLAATIGGVTGDAAVDSVTVNGSSGANAVTIAGSGTSVSVTGLTASVAITNAEGANDTLTVNGGGGNDTITATTLPAGVVNLVLDGGANNDSIFGSQAADIIFGGDGNDFVLGDNGNDTAFLGANDDVFEWAPGDGNDIIEGQAGFDELRFGGSNASESINVAANGGRVLFTRDVASVTMDLDDVEKILYAALGGADNVTIGNMTGTDATNVEVSLAASGGGGDGAADTVTVNATNGADTITASSSAGVVSVTGLAWTVSVSDAEAANDRLVLNALGGDDVIDASTLAAGLLSLTINGGLGTDLVVGSGGDDLVIGGDGNDTALLGGGNDVFVWNPGDDNDVIEGQAGTDTLTFNGANIGEVITITPNGGRVLFFRDVAAVTMDLNDTEVIQFAALGGADTIVVDDLSATDVTQVTLDLASTVGGAAGDAAVDTLTLNASGEANTITVSGATGALITVTGLPTNVTISQFETSATVDRLSIMAFGGNDTISATGLIPHFSTLTIDGGVGDDTIRSNGDGTYLGGVGNDLLFAGLTNSVETIDGGDGIDTLDTTSWGGTYTIDMISGATNYSGESFTNFENLITGAGADTITGTAGANTISTGGGNDTLDGGLGNDTLIGGTGDDTYFVDASGDVVIEAAGGGNDRVMTSASYTLSAGSEVELLSTTNNAGTDPINLKGNELAQTVAGNAGANTLDGGGGADILNGLGGNDFYIVDNSADVVLESAGGGNDRIFASTHYTLAAGVEIETLSTTNNAGIDPINLTGNEFAQTVAGNAGSNILNGGGGADILNGLGGNDFYFVDNAGDVVLETAGNGNDRILSSVSYTLAAGVDVEVLSTTNNAGTDAINLKGNELAQTVAGNAGANTLDGGGGADILNGLGGNDFYFVDNSADVVLESAGGGNDRIFASTHYTLAAGVEIETLSTTNNAGTDAINLTGNEFAQTVAGNAGSNILNGGGGADILNGLGGNDFYFVDNAGDVVLETAGNGNDRILASVSRRRVDVEVLSTTNNAGTDAINLKGNELAQTVAGNAGANTLDGGGGADILNGLGGNDFYIVDNAGDVVLESAGNGNDRILSSVSYVLAAGVDVEILSTTNNAGTDPINLKGNELAQTVAGNAGANTLDGGGGADILNGLGGNDFYIVDNSADVVLESAGGGNDRIFASTHYTLAAGVEIETLSTTNNAGIDPINLTGNEFAQTVAGNAGSNILNGGGGADILNGLGGNDFYFVDNAGDVVLETAGNGNDRILSSVSYTLAAGVDVEVLSTTNNAGTDAINLTGNELAQTVAGNDGANILNGGGGNDILNGLGGADTYRFTSAIGPGNIATILGYVVADDVIELDDGLFTGLATGALAVGAFNTGAAATQADDRIIYNSATGALLFDVDGVGGAAGIQFATLATGLAMTASEFMVV